MAVTIPLPHLDDGPVEVLLQRFDADLPLPAYARRGDAGLDLRAATGAELPAGGGRALVPTGIAVAIPAGFAGFVQPRSGLARDHGVTCLNTPGLIDSGYRGELKVLLVNTDPSGNGKGADVVLTAAVHGCDVITQSAEVTLTLAFPLLTECVETGQLLLTRCVLEQYNVVTVRAGRPETVNAVGR